MLRHVLTGFAGFLAFALAFGWLLSAHAQGDQMPAGVDPKMTSDDADYGSEKKPIKLGSKDELGGPKAERAYLDALRDEAGKPVTYKRIGSVGKSPDGNVMDLYEVTTASGTKFKLYIDMYHPKNQPGDQPAPKGLFKAKK